MKLSPAESVDRRQLHSSSREETSSAGAQIQRVKQAGPRQGPGSSMAGMEAVQDTPGSAELFPRIGFSGQSLDQKMLTHSPGLGRWPGEQPCPSLPAGLLVCPPQVLSSSRLLLLSCPAGGWLPGQAGALLVEMRGSAHRVW